MTNKLLLHICCGPCSTSVVPTLDGFSVTGFYYNPNIYPEAEYDRRLASAKKVAEKMGIELVVPEQKREDFFEFIGETKQRPDRCFLCYKQRLDLTAKYAKENGYSFFSTMLMVSPYQNVGYIMDLGREIGKKYGVNFFDKDFRPLYQESRELSKEMELYMQKYCGCKFSRKRR